MSCSQRKTEANRRNATKSTGPKTDEGKAVASRNATTHGLTAATSPVALDESQEEFDAFASALRADLRPRGAMQQVLVERIIHLSWKLRRLPAVEAEAIRAMEPHIHTDQKGPYGARIPLTAAQTIACEACRGTLERLQAYESRIERSLFACLKELASIRKIQAEDPARQDEPTETEAAEVRSPSPGAPGEGRGEGRTSEPSDDPITPSVQNEPTELTAHVEVPSDPDAPRRGKAVLRDAPDPPASDSRARERMRQ